MVSFCESVKFRIEENLKLKNTIDPKTFFCRIFKCKIKMEYLEIFEVNTMN